jgi:hypothetical protein
MGNIVTHSSVLVPSTVFDEKDSLNMACCTFRKEDRTFTPSASEQRRSCVSYASLNVSAVRSTPYRPRLDIEASIPNIPVSNIGTLILANNQNSDPEPLSSWTIQEQQVLIDSLSKHPQARENESYRQRLMETVKMKLPNKTLDEIKECYNYLREVRLAHVKCRRSSLNQRVSPNQEGKALTFQT